MRHADYSPSRLPAEWLTAIQAAQQRTLPEPHAPRAPRRPSEAEPPETYEHALELRSLISQLKRERLRKGLNLGDVSKLTQQARSALSRLETGEYPNPTLHTLYRYARALGWHIKFCAEPIAQPQPPGPDDADATPRRRK
jgi:Helix-turn-helix